MSTAPSEVLMPVEKKKKVKKPVEANPLLQDELAALAHRVEKMSREEALEAIHPLMEEVDSNYLKLGGVLAVIRDHDEWWKSDEVDTFKEFVQQGLGINYRKVMYLIQCYSDLIESGVEWEQVKSIGWCKLKEVSSVITKENAAEWVAKAEALTILQLRDVVKQAQAKALQGSGVNPEGVESTTTTLSIKCHVDQKDTIKLAIEKAKKDAHTEFDAVALEAVCINYLSGGKVTKKPKAQSLKQILADYDPEAVLTAFGETWPDIELEARIP